VSAAALCLLAVLALATLASAPPAAGQGLLPGPAAAKLRTGDRITISGDETVPHDLYVVGGEVRHDGRVEGDLVVSGGQIDVDGPVTGDLLVAGGTVRVNGPVGGAVRIAGGQATLTGDVGKDVAFAGGSLAIAPTARVGGDLLLGAGQAAVAGTVAGDVLGSAGAYSRDGRVAGQERVTVGQAATPPPPPTLADRIADQVRRFAGIALVGALLVALLPAAAVLQPAAALRDRPLQGLVAGALGVAGFVALLLALVVATALLALVFGGLTLGGLLGVTVVAGVLAVGLTGLAFALAVQFVAPALVGLVLGSLALDWFDRQDGLGARVTAGRWRPVVALLLGALLVVALAAIPVVGPVLNLLAVLLGLGGLVLAGWEHGHRPAGAAAGEASAPPEPPVLPAIPARPAA
jgi:hypothetical protein